MAEQQDYTYDQQANGEGGFEQFEQQQQNAEPMEGQETDYNASAGGGGEGSKVMDDDDDRWDRVVFSILALHWKLSI